MTDPTTEETITLAEERKSRLTELAQRVWTSKKNVRLDNDGDVVYDDEHFDCAVVIWSCRHPHTLDALEATLLVLSGVDEPLSTSQAKDAFGEGFASAQQLAGQVPIAPDWIALEMEKRIAEREARHAHERITELEAKLAMVSQAHERYWRTDGTGIDREVYDAVIAAVVDTPGEEELLRARHDAGLTPTVLAILDEERDAREPSAASLREIPEAGPDAVRFGRGAEGRENARKIGRQLQKAYRDGFERGRAGLSENNILVADTDRIGRIRAQLDQGKCRDSDVRYLLMLVEDLNDRLAKIAAHVNDRELPDDEARLFIAGVLDDRVAEVDEPHTEEM